MIVHNEIKQARLNAYDNSNLKRELRGSTFGDWCLKLVTFSVYVLLLMPTVIVFLTAFNSEKYLHFPPAGFSLQWFEKLLESDLMLTSLGFTLKLAFSSAAMSTCFGLMAALFIVRFGGRFSNALKSFVLSPLMMPAILTGTALMIFYYQMGYGNKTYFGLLAAHTLITTPYVFLVISSVLYNFDYSTEEAARSLGATAAQTFWYITLPHIRSGVIGAYVFAFITSFDEFPLSLMLTGPGFSVISVQMFDYLRFEFDPLIAAVSTFNIAVAAVVMIIIEKSVGLKTIYGGKAKNPQS